MRPSSSFRQSHLAGDAERTRNNIARRTTRWTCGILLAFILGVGVGWLIFS